MHVSPHAFPLVQTLQQPGGGGCCWFADANTHGESIATPAYVAVNWPIGLEAQSIAVGEVEDRDAVEMMSSARTTA